MLNVGDKLICKTEGQPETEFCIEKVPVRLVNRGIMIVI